MSDARDLVPPGPAQDRPVGELVRQMSEQVSVLVRDELRLAQLEVTRKAKKAGIGAGLLSGSGLLALYGTGCLIGAAIAALSLVLAVWAAALIAAGGLFVVAGVVALAGRTSLRGAVPPVPAEATESIKTDVHVIKEKAAGR